MKSYLTVSIVEFLYQKVIATTCYQFLFHNAVMTNCQNKEYVCWVFEMFGWAKQTVFLFILSLALADSNCSCVSWPTFFPLMLGVQYLN